MNDTIPDDVLRLALAAAYKAIHGQSASDVLALVRQHQRYPHSWRTAVAAAEAVYRHMRVERDAAQAEAKRWKSNHDNQVKLRRALLDRPDLKERAALVQNLAAERDAAQAEANRLQELLGELLARIHGDGGHHCLEHGYEASTQAADEKVVALKMAEDEVKRLREALEFYANKDNWGISKSKCADEDRGDIARAALDNSVAAQEEAKRLERERDEAVKGQDEATAQYLRTLYKLNEAQAEAKRLRDQIDAVGQAVAGNTQFGDVVPYVKSLVSEVVQLREQVSAPAVAEAKRLREALDQILGAWDCLMRTDGARHEMASNYTAGEWAHGNGMAKGIDMARSAVMESHLDYASRKVATWPEWKRNLLGRTNAPNPDYWNNGIISDLRRQVEQLERERDELRRRCQNAERAAKESKT